MNPYEKLRLKLASKAMQAMIANPKINRPIERPEDFIIFSERAFRYADGMIEFLQNDSAKK